MNISKVLYLFSPVTTMNKLLLASLVFLGLVAYCDAQALPMPRLTVGHSCYRELVLLILFAERPDSAAQGPLPEDESGDAGGE